MSGGFEDSGDPGAPSQKAVGVVCMLAKLAHKIAKNGVEGDELAVDFAAEVSPLPVGAFAGMVDVQSAFEGQGCGVFRLIFGQGVILDPGEIALSEETAACVVELGGVVVKLVARIFALDAVEILEAALHLGESFGQRCEFSLVLQRNPPRAQDEYAAAEIGQQVFRLDASASRLDAYDVGRRVADEAQPHAHGRGLRGEFEETAFRGLRFESHIAGVTHIIDQGAAGGAEVALRQFQGVVRHTAQSPIGVDGLDEGVRKFRIALEIGNASRGDAQANTLEALVLPGLRTVNGCGQGVHIIDQWRERDEIMLMEKVGECGEQSHDVNAGGVGPPFGAAAFAVGSSWVVAQPHAGAVAVRLVTRASKPERSLSGVS